MLGIILSEAAYRHDIGSDEGMATVALDCGIWRHDAGFLDGLTVVAALYRHFGTSVRRIAVLGMNDAAWSFRHRVLRPMSEFPDHDHSAAKGEGNDAVPIASVRYEDLAHAAVIPVPLPFDRKRRVVRNGIGNQGVTGQFMHRRIPERGDSPECRRGREE